MIFSSIFFLFFFLPLVVVAYFSSGWKIRNMVLLGASLLFYAWGEVGYVFLMLFSIIINYVIGLWINTIKADVRRARLALTCGIVINLLPLAFFKYGNFLVDNINILLTSLALHPVSLNPLHLPIGISFFTFQALSYIIDVYRNQVQVQHRLVNLALYIALFPQLIAGPIVRYKDVALQIVSRTTTLGDFKYGVQRFVIGLGKKVLIANTVGRVADHIFILQSTSTPASLIWLGIICYSIQIYYDFSGYSDMAIGLGRIFGFRFLENFNYPYAATSIQDFWRRWHISLSSWFKDYLYIPLGGNQKGKLRTYFNLLTVFFLCGLWHGASWNFIVWGLFHGLFLVLERLGLGNAINKLPNILRHTYTIAVFMTGWIFFRTESIPEALEYLSCLSNFDKPPYLDAQLFSALNVEFYVALACGVIFCFPIIPTTIRTLTGFYSESRYLSKLAWDCLEIVFSVSWIVVIFIYSTAQLLSGSHNPFLYFRF